MFRGIGCWMAQYNEGLARRAQMEMQAKAEMEKARRTMQAYLDAHRYRDQIGQPFKFGEDPLMRLSKPKPSADEADV